MRLQVGDRSPLTLVVGGEPAIFPGDSPASASLVDGPIRDLNVMTRRGHFSHSVSVVDFAGSTSLRAAADISLLLLRHGRISLHSPHGAAELEPGDAVIDEAARAGDPLRCEGAGVLYHVSILRA